MPAISLVIPTLNRPEYLLSCINDLLNQTVKDFEILVIDQSDIEIHNELVSKINDLRVKFIYLKERSASKARNLGIKNAAAEVILFLDDDIIINNRDFVKNHLKHYTNPATIGVSGAILNKENDFRQVRSRLSHSIDYGWLFFPINYAYPCKVGNAWAGNMSFRTKYTKEVGGMDERYAKGAFREESDFCTRIVRRFGALEFDPQAYLVHIGATKGGLRTFSSADLVKAQHHFDGFFYYTLKYSKWNHWIYHLMSFKLIFFNRNVLKSSKSIRIALKRTWNGFRNGKKMKAEGPIYIL